MKHTTAIGRALDAVRSSDPLEATRLIQEALGGSGRPETHASKPPLSSFPIPQALDLEPQESRSNKSKRRAGLAETIAALRSFKLPIDISSHRPDITLPESMSLQNAISPVQAGSATSGYLSPPASNPAV